MFATPNSWSALDQQSLEKAVRESFDYDSTPFDELVKKVVNLYKHGRLERDDFETLIHYLLSIQIEREVSRKVDNALHSHFCPQHGSLMKI